jgi:hypothetical protein
MKAPFCLQKPVPREIFDRGRCQFKVQPDSAAPTIRVADAALPIFSGKMDEPVWGSNLAPPPTDLVVALQHFLI